ncbi:hypothetical protein HZU40_34150 (plasmid) [Mycolicibacterium fluoranthenivorans]|uniref:Uncharacterized protein n=1 Tax=Mycolicibacterium fluoranthenivorans TaxID=258505 RepID=A0A7G8PQF1_9MYCO|nr:hypothetical protein [Mycolicibacterium fluoranthenivorans]QNJ96567.1 hypothetical protein HZU40_34150 [Mycolicibacterium fluoranthenivorans]
MTWTTQLTYTAAGLTDEDTAALAEALGGADIAYAADRLQVNLEVEASTLEEAAASTLRTAAAATGLLKPTRLRVLPTPEFLDETAHPEPMNLDLIGITEIAAELGVSRQRAGQLADDPDFPAPVVQPASGRLYTRASVKAFQQRWTATRNPRGGRRRRQPTPTAT